MERWMKYAGIGVGLFLFLMSATVIALPLIFNVQRYLPEIAEKLSAVTGRPVTIGPDLTLSFFPTPTISFSDLQIGNPEGYLSDSFVRIASFEARFALLPLLKRELAISRFIISGLEVNLEKKVDGEVNWDFSKKKLIEESSTEPVAAVPRWFFPQGLTIDLLVVTDGMVNWLDSKRQGWRTYADLMLIVNHFSLDDAVAVEFRASTAGKALVAEGKVGPLGHMPGNGPWMVDLAAGFIDTFSGQITGKIIETQNGTGSGFVLQVPPSSARDLLSLLAAEVPAPAVTSAPAGVESVDIDMHEKGQKEKAGTGKVRINPLEIKESWP